NVCPCRIRCASAQPAAAPIYTLSLHDALPIWSSRSRPATISATTADGKVAGFGKPPASDSTPGGVGARILVTSALRLCVRVANRSEEHTSELQSQSNLVCRLLLEKKNKKDMNK